MSIEFRQVSKRYGDAKSPLVVKGIDLVVPKGTTVTWVNHDMTRHTVTSAETERYDSGMMGNKAEFSHTFNTPGRYQYLCMPHPGMQAEIIVQ